MRTTRKPEKTGFTAEKAENAEIAKREGPRISRRRRGNTGMGNLTGELGANRERREKAISPQSSKIARREFKGEKNRDRTRE
jgi:hypothetical protein